MRRGILVIPLLILSMLLSVCAGIVVSVETESQTAQPQKTQELLTNSSIMKLVKAGLSERFITDLINTRPGRYSLTAEDIAALKKGGVSEKVIAAMASRSGNGLTPGVAAPPPASSAIPSGTGGAQREPQPTPKTGEASAADQATASGKPTGETTASGQPIYEGPRGGRYHISKSGKKVYERRSR